MADTDCGRHASARSCAFAKQSIIPSFSSTNHKLQSVPLLRCDIAACSHSLTMLDIIARCDAVLTKLDMSRFALLLCEAPKQPYPGHALPGHLLSPDSSQKSHRLWCVYLLYICIFAMNCMNAKGASYHLPVVHHIQLSSCLRQLKASSRHQAL